MARLKGKRLPDNTPPSKPGEYAWMDYEPGWWPPTFLGKGEWHIVDPTGGIGALGRITAELPQSAHEVTIHDNGTITCSPSLVMPSGWHGWLKEGVFTQ